MLLSDIPTDAFNRIIAELRAAGWKQVKEYNGVGAWIDYGLVLLQKQGVRLSFEWDNWCEAEKSRAAGRPKDVSPDGAFHRPGCQEASLIVTGPSPFPHLILPNGARVPAGRDGVLFPGTLSA